MTKPKVLVLRTAGTNCDLETQYAFEKVGAEAERVHINRVLENKRSLHDYQIIVIPGGFTYGDDIAAGKIFANELHFSLQSNIEEFIKAGKLILGICNGFQVLVKSGLLPGLNSDAGAKEQLNNPVTFSFNDSNRFEDRWVYLKACSSKSPFVQKGDDIYIPAANAEGKFVAKDELTIKNLKKSDQVVYKYVNKDGEEDGYPWNPSGSMDNIAGICDSTGQIFGMMPHPERHIEPTHHPRWTREGLKSEGEGVKIFRNAVNYVKEKFG